MTVSRLLLCIQANNRLKSRGYLHIITNYYSSKPESHSVTSVDVGYGNFCHIMTASRLPLSNELIIIMRNSRFFHNIIIILELL